MPWQIWVSGSVGAVAVLLWVLARGFQKPVLNYVALIIAAAGFVVALNNFMTTDEILHITLAGLVGWFARSDYELREK